MVDVLSLIGDALAPYSDGGSSNGNGAAASY